MTAEFFGFNTPTATGPDAELLDDLKGVFKRDWNNHPRSLQKHMGPSEVGHPCARKLAARMIGLKAINPDGDPLPAWLGTAGHSKFEQAVLADNERIIKAHKADSSMRCTYHEGVPIGRWFPERKVDVTDTLRGTCDLYDTWTDTVVDLKFPGASRMTYYTKNGPSPEYRIQSHLYGRGYRNEGFNVQRVAIWFLPRGGYLSKSFVWSEDYSDSVVDEVLTRLDQVAVLVNDLDLARNPDRLSLIPTTPHDCNFCEFWSTTSDEPHACKDGKL